MLGTFIESAIFGRIMINSIGSIESAILVTVGVSIGEILSKIIVRRRISFVEWFCMKQCNPCCFGKEYIDGDKKDAEKSGIPTEHVDDVTGARVSDRNAEEIAESEGGKRKGVCCCDCELDRKDYYRTAIFYCL